MKNSRKPTKFSVPAKKKFAIPPAFLAQLKEFSQGGYILIIGDENGDPQVHPHFDNSLAAMGLTMFARNWLNSACDAIDNIAAVNGDSGREEE